MRGADGLRFITGTGRHQGGTRTSHSAVSEERHRYITFNRPKVLNALRPGDYYLLDELVSACDRDERLRALIFTGRGRAWSVDDDINVAVAGRQREEWMKKDPVQTLMWKQKCLDLVLSRQLIATQERLA